MPNGRTEKISVYQGDWQITPLSPEDQARFDRIVERKHLSVLRILDEAVQQDAGHNPDGEPTLIFSTVIGAPEPTAAGRASRGLEGVGLHMRDVQIRDLVTGRLQTNMLTAIDGPMPNPRELVAYPNLSGILEIHPKNIADRDPGIGFVAVRAGVIKAGFARPFSGELVIADVDPAPARAAYPTVPPRPRLGTTFQGIKF